MKGLRILGIFLLVVLACIGPTVLLPAIGWGVAFPVTAVPAEPIIETGIHFLGFPLNLNNTLTSLIVADIIVILLAVWGGASVRRKLQQYEADPKAVDSEGNDLMVPEKGWPNTFEALTEYMFNLTESIIGSKWSVAVFPLVMTIFFFTLTANWMHFLPVTDTIGTVHCADPRKGKAGYPVVPAFAAPGANVDYDNYATGEIHGNEFITGGFWRLDVSAALSAEEEKGARCPEGTLALEEGEKKDPDAGFEAESPDDYRYVVTPWVRTLTTDLNYTFGLAIIAMVMVQYYGIRELGLGYFSKFFNFGALDNGFIGVIEFAVGLIELVGEFLKVLSFALRLFGNLFAGMVLLFAMVFLVPLLVPLPFFFLEVLIGALQAFVFAMLTIVFIAVAQIGHGDHGDDHH